MQNVQYTIRTYYKQLNRIKSKTDFVYVLNDKTMYSDRKNRLYAFYLIIIQILYGLISLKTFKNIKIIFNTPGR